MDQEQIKQEISQVKTLVVGLPKWRLYLYASVIVLILIYMAWSIWGKRPIKIENGFVATKPAISAAKQPGPTVQLRVIPKAAVIAKFPQAKINLDDVVVDTAKIPPLKNGGTAVVTISEATGEASTQIQASPAPWLAFERNNTLGAGIEIGTQGQKVPIYYRRDLLRIKDVHILAELGAKIALSPTEKTEAHAAALVEYRW